MAGSIAKAYVQVIPSAEGIKGKLSGLLGGEASSAGDSAGQSFGSSMIGKIKGILAAAGIGKMLGESLQAGGALQQSLGGVETLFKDSAAQVIANAEKSYKTAGMSANQYMETVTGYSASLLKSLGGDTQAAAAYADRALVDMADNVNKFGTSAEAIQNAYQGFAKQNYTMLDNLKLGYGGTQAEMQRLIAEAANMKEAQEALGVTVDANSMSFSNIVDAISVVQKNMGITGATADEAAKTFSGSMAAMKASFSDVLANLSLGRDIGPSLTALGETVFTFLKGNLLPMVGNILGTLPEVLSSAFSMAIQGLNMASANADTFLQVGIDLVTGIGTAIITAAPYLAEAGFNLVASLGSAILSTDWAQLASDTITSLRGSLDLAASEILGTDGDIVGSMLTAIASGLPDILATGGEMLSTLVLGITGALPGLTASALQLLVSFVGQLISGLPQVLSTGKTILLSVVQGIQTALPSMLASAGEAIGTLLGGIVKNLPSILAAGFDLVITLISGIGNAAPDLFAGAGKLLQNIGRAVKDINWKQLGKDIVNGLINGLGAMGNALWNAAKSIAKSALNAIKSALGIASPSKVMRDQVGKWIPSGLAVGIKANTKPLTDAMHSLSGLTTESLQTDLQLTGNALRMPASVAAQPALTTTGGISLDQIIELLTDLVEGSAARESENNQLIKELTDVVGRIKVGDETIARAVNRYNRRTAAMNGGW